jgi:antitoxin CptB
MTGLEPPAGKPAPTPLSWRVRRGMKELDVLLERYVRTGYARAGEAERAAFVRLLEREDPEIWSWVLGQAEPPPGFADVVAALRRHP